MIRLSKFIAMLLCIQSQQNDQAQLTEGKINIVLEFQEENELINIGKAIKSKKRQNPRKQRQNKSTKFENHEGIVLVIKS